MFNGVISSELNNPLDTRACVFSALKPRSPLTNLNRNVMRHASFFLNLDFYLSILDCSSFSHKIIIQLPQPPPRRIFRVRQIESKMKFYYVNRCLGIQK